MAIEVFLLLLAPIPGKAIGIRISYLTNPPGEGGLGTLISFLLSKVLGARRLVFRLDVDLTQVLNQYLPLGIQVHRIGVHPVGCPRQVRALGRLLHLRHEPE